LLVVCGLLLACGGGGGAASKPATGGGGGGAQNITIKSQDTMRFDPATITVRANTPVSVTLDNSGAALVHDFTVDNLGGAQVQAKAQPRQRASAQFTAATPGTYQFYCAEPGHKEAGMVGTMTVS
jgi:uncharacterized cupredoxin-like copper-binding protein